MNEGKQRISSVEVSVVDISSLETEALTRIKATVPNVVSVSSPYKWGIVATEKGVYALCDEGVGNNKPVTGEAPLCVDLYGEYAGEGGGKTIDILPVLRATLRDKELLALPVLEKKNLADFIRRFGSRLEENFEMWNAVLTQVMA